MPQSTAEIDWKNESTPVSRQFGDVYFSAEDGLAETRHVFLAGNDLPSRWADRRRFCIVETGFGTGLNFLATWDLWRRHRPVHGRLHYVSVEAFPLSVADMARALQHWRELSDLSDQLLRVYPVAQRGFHRLHFCDDVTLTLLIGDAGEMLGELEASVDAWYLDGFAPSRNPEMWRPAIFTEVGRLSAPGATLATFTVAGQVRRSLVDAGFDVEKTPGYGRKREMCRARYKGGDARSNSPEWFYPATDAITDERATILGGGVAGAAVAHALRRRNWKVTLVERHDRLAQEGSGNHRGIIMPRLSLDDTPDSRFYTGAYRYLLQNLHTFPDAGSLFEECGVLQLPQDEPERRRFRGLVERAVLPDAFLRFVTAREASKIAGQTIHSDALFFPQGGAIAPVRFCQLLAQGAELATESEVHAISRRDRSWVLLDKLGIEQSRAPVCVVANGARASDFGLLAWLPLQAIRGQISMVAPTDASRSLKTIVLGRHYALPLRDGLHVLGATFDRTSTRAQHRRQAVKRGDHERIRQGVEDVLPGVFTDVDLDRFRGRASLRCSTTDQHPLIGAAPDEIYYRESFGPLRHGARHALPPARYHEGLFLHLALGSRGLTTALLGGELLASQICGDPWPVERSVAESLHPGRFLIRQIRRSR